MPNWSSNAAGEGRRRSQRVILSIPVTVTGETGQGPFSEKTATLVINAHGALVPLAAKLAQGQKLELKSATSAEPQPCTVVYVGPTVQGKTQFGVEFTAAAPFFWQISFPPEDWTAASVEEPATQSAGKPQTAPAVQPQKTALKK